MPGGIDPTGYVKGWAAQRALGAFRASGVCGAIVNAAGDIASFGDLGGGKLFRVGIADPFSPGRLAEVVYLTGAIATSGTYERGNHLIDPRSGLAARVASASVTGPDLGLADALATAVAVAGEAGLDLIEALDGYEALTIAFDGRRRWTENFPFAPHAALPPAERLPQLPRTAPKRTAGPGWPLSGGHPRRVIHLYRYLPTLSQEPCRRKRLEVRDGAWC